MTIKTPYEVVIADINETQNGSTISLKIRFRIIYYLVFVLVVLFNIPFIFSDNVVLNGVSNPDMAARFAFLGIFLLLSTIPIFILLVHKKNFLKKVEKTLELDPLG